MGAPRLGWYGDDFTGATDTLAVLAQAGLRAMLFMGVPDAMQQAAARKSLGGELDAVGIAGISRSLAPQAMRAELEPVGRFFNALQCPVLHYKVCSTFDSAPEVGSIGAAVEVLRKHVPNALVPIVGGQPSLGRYCAFSNLFAAAGVGGAVDRIDRHPTMRCHPVTPMMEADLRRHLSLQGVAAVGMHYPVYAEAPATQTRILQAMLNAKPQAIVMDVAVPEHLSAVGRLIWELAAQSPLLAVGASSVAQALVVHWGTIGELPTTAGTAGHTPLRAARGPVFVFAGSLSPVTAQQVQAAGSYEAFAVDADALLDSPHRTARAHDQVRMALAQGRHVLAHTDPTKGTAADTGRSAALAQATAQFVKNIVMECAKNGQPLQSIGIAGGDTSSIAVKALGGWGLSYRGTLGAGVTVSNLHSSDPALDGLELMLKGGQMGGKDVFERLISP
jgi:3-oxoisoapionate kinase